MRAKSLLLMSMVLAGLAGCESGDVNLGVSTTDNSVINNPGGGNGGGTSNPCASYATASGQTRQGTFDGTDCTYSASFVSASNPLTVNVTIPALPTGGTHFFNASMFVGRNVSSGAAPQAGDVPNTAEGAILTIEPGVTLAFARPTDYLLINRGSQIIADGLPDAPITFTGDEDPVLGGTAGPQDVELWGGIVINGNGLTNLCTDAQRANNQCHIISEGAASHYGGNNNAESSGILRYVVVKHTGYEVAPNDELNGITFNAVGSGTVIENLQVYSTYDDGIEFFGGAANVRNFVALYVRDDSFDFSDGYSGTVENALIIHARDNSNWCVEGDNVGSGRTSVGVPADTPPVANPTVRNMTCITSHSPGGTHGDSRGVIIRQGARAQIENSIIYDGYGLFAHDRASGTQCLEFAGAVSADFAVAGDSTMQDTIIACKQPTAVAPPPAAPIAFANAAAVVDWVNGVAPYTFNTGNHVVVTDANNPAVTILEPGTFYTAPALTDAAGQPIPAPSTGHYGAVTRDNDWTAGWTYGLHEDNRGQPLWFE